MCVWGGVLSLVLFDFFDFLLGEAVGVKGGYGGHWEIIGIRIDDVKVPNNQ